MKTAICLQHVTFEGPGVFEQALLDADFAVEKWVVPVIGLPPDAGDFLLVMGGPMSVNDPDPWIADELSFIRTAIDAGVPYLGICLGSQMLARAMGGSVSPGEHVEIGMTQVELTEQGVADPVVGVLPSPVGVFEWHGEGIQPPPDAVVLARSEQFATQAFRIGSNAYGVLFHIEMEREGVQALCKLCPDDIERSGKLPEEILSDAAEGMKRMHASASAMVQALTSC